MTDEKYNGWTNWATWDANLWMENEEPTYRDSVRLAEEYRDDAAELSRALRTMFEETYSPEDIAGPLADAWNGFLGDVDWYEIAQAQIDGLPPEDEDQD